MIFVRDQVLECVSPIPGLIGGALYVCDGMERAGAWTLVRVTAVHDGERGVWWPFRFKAAEYELASARLGVRRP